MSEDTTSDSSGVVVPEKVVDELLDENPERFTLLPIRYPELWKMYEQAKGSFWTEKEIDFSHDRSDFAKLTREEQHFIKRILAFFANFDAVVNENLAAQMYSVVQVPEARAFYAMQMMMETIHAEVYALQIDVLVSDVEERNYLSRSIRTVPAIKDMASWALNWTNNPRVKFAERLIAFAIIEGVVFTGAFCAIYWLGYYRKKCQGLCQSNDWIARDEGLHAKFACLLYRTPQPANQISSERIYQIMQEAIPPIESFISESLPYDLTMMNAGLMREYIRYKADGLLKMLGVEPLYKSANPFPFMEAISYNKQANFFEVPPTEYGLRGFGAAGSSGGEPGVLKAVSPDDI